MSPDLDPAVEAAARACFDHDKLLDEIWNGLTEDDRASYRALAVAVLTAVAPLIRAQERAAVRAELIAMAQELEPVERAWPKARPNSVALRYAADHLAPEHTTPREKP